MFGSNASLAAGLLKLVHYECYKCQYLPEDQKWLLRRLESSALCISTYILYSIRDSQHTTCVVNKIRPYVFSSVWRSEVIGLPEGSRPLQWACKLNIAIHLESTKQQNSLP
jgi:hypothetical protein